MGTEVPITAFSVETGHTNVNVGIWGASKKVFILNVGFREWFLHGHSLQPPEIFTNLHPLCVGFLCKKEKTFI